MCRPTLCSRNFALEVSIKLRISDRLLNEKIAKLPKYLQRTSGSELRSGGKINQQAHDSSEGEERTHEHRVPITTPYRTNSTH